MALVVSNYCRTTLRAGITPSSTQLLLASGGSLCLNIGSGNFCYLTIEDGSSAEVVKFTNSGIIVSDTITVLRAQDGTTAKSFPAGACVKVAWNVAQVTDLVEQTFVDLFDSSVIPPNTIQVSSPPVAAPPANVIYAVDTATRQFWYWNGSSWYELGNPRDGVLAGTVDPSGPPSNTTAFYVNTTTGMLFYWDGSAWVPVGSGSGGVGGRPNTEEFWVRGAIGTLYTLPSETQVELGVIAMPDLYRVYPNGIAANTKLQTIVHAGSPRTTLLAAAAMEVIVSVSGNFGGSPVPNAIMQLVISNNIDASLYGNASPVDPDFQPDIQLNASTGVRPWPSGAYFDGNIGYSQSGAGPWANFIIKQVTTEFHIIETL